MTSNPALATLHSSFWAWREAAGPSTADDLPRLPRPEGWVADWSAEAIAARRARWAEFARGLEAIDLEPLSTPDRVDARLLRSALDRVEWELSVRRVAEVDPLFYVEQAGMPIFEELLTPSGFDASRTDRLRRHLENVPALLDQAQANLSPGTSAATAQLAQTTAARLERSLRESISALAGRLPVTQAGSTIELSNAAAAALLRFRSWILDPGRCFIDTSESDQESLAFLLHRVALYPHPMQHLRDLAVAERNRAIAAEQALGIQVRAAHPDAPPSGELPELMHRAEEGARLLRQFCAGSGVLGDPSIPRRYELRSMPDYLSPLSWFGLANDFSDWRRASENAVRYVSSSEAGDSYFELLTARDPLVGNLLHEAVHARQLAMSWQHPNPARRRFYDSLPNEGIACYHEELMLLGGLLKERPHSARRVASLVRLRAARARIEIDLALGSLDLDEASRQLSRELSVSREAARHEVARLAAAPGQMLSYLAGKHQVFDLLAAAVDSSGDSFDLGCFHDRLWVEGNVPLTLQYWELIGDPTPVNNADRLAAATARPAMDTGAEHARR